MLFYWNKWMNDKQRKKIKNLWKKKKSLSKNEMWKIEEMK